ncbi:TadE/TadG family type IV pilus assembly protein [Blastococcus sp. TF02A_35]|uniref:TadE/TadG family type IV pilus assembly protein n=1 Tax=Blastococcus sp. TF02A-35 TaxID=2559612 RepID=UPI0010746602|nr:TadE/TadG family type IV pilus assembly protein [Blastococcus sp. TF02A_35]TFV52078.1 pilus assembly protein [Blastococcus sp. TF02A_35]
MPESRARRRPAVPPCDVVVRPGRPSRGGGSDRGSSSVEFAILFPIIVTLLLAGPQLAMWYFAREAADAAAHAGARAASVSGAAGGAGQEAADQYLARLGTGTITRYSVEEQDTATTVTVHVTAEVPNVIPLPGFAPTVDVTVTRGKERFTTPNSP